MERDVMWSHVVVSRGPGWAGGGDILCVTIGHHRFISPLWEVRNAVLFAAGDITGTSDLAVPKSNH